MNIKKRKLSDSMKNVVKISGGTIVGQVISVVTLPIITRIYGANIMGIWATILSVAMILQSISDLGMTSSLMLEEEDKVITCYTVITSISFMMSIAASIVIFPFFVLTRGYSPIESIVYTVLAITYAFTVKQVNTSYTLLNRKKQYNVLMKNPIVNYSSVALFSILFWMLGMKAYGYYLAVIIGQLFTLVNMRRVLPKVFLDFKKEDYLEQFRKYKDLFMYQTPNNLMLQMRDQLPNLLIGSFFGDTMLGYYSVSVRILNMPVTFIGQAVGKVFYQTISESNRKGERIQGFVQRNFSRAIFLCAFPVVCLFAGGDIVAVMFFGAEYMLAGQMLRIVVFKTVLTFISTCMQGLEIVLRKQRYALITTCLQMIASSLAVVIGALLTNNIFYTIVIMTFFYIVVQLIYYSKLFAIMAIKAKVILLNIGGLFILTLILGTIVRYFIAVLIHLFDIGFLQWFAF